MPLVPKNYPKEYSEQEKQLMAQISARRKAYMQKYGAAESNYVNADPSKMVTDRVHTYDRPARDKGDGSDDPRIVQRLFR